ncbi:kinase-like domain-containing protein [Cokeromyces recurvatus]|uniref:kinase-like domain-containing protein n=1 Tax=Cokeromyces recurvatus TaxID=90255 RepID=UPI0022203701|nr:kinase-like domain-containing protein [Cokeromyces recurvatus]KAI7905994.1 kinase-like domain-containing protein [Cokeromyces recurvatus]
MDKYIDNQNYQLLEELGRGSYGCLFLAQSFIDNNYVAVKILSKRGLDSNQLSLQQLEIDIQQSLQHPHLLGLQAVIQEQDYVFIVMELCDGGDLFDYVIHSHNHYYPTIDSNKGIVEEQTIEIFSQILDAVDYLHQNEIYHRDIKLENILLLHENNLCCCKLADFGLATRERYSVDFGCGSVTYLGPEHYNNNNNAEESSHYDAAASDIWSLGILLLALLFGKNPWQEATEADPNFWEYMNDPNSLQYQLFPVLSDECLEFLTDSILCIDPKNRYVNISDMKRDFLKITTLFTKEDNHIMTALLLPLDIPPIQPSKENKSSYDSAIFSQQGDESGLNHSDNEDEITSLFQLNISIKEQEEDDDDDLFIHIQEKESWWL